ncbi:poly-gamma-glutamate synthase PgsB [Myxococcota bacterium]|nr:poly-gamma-glutamate synthase PgsB [Myxococcota bacterium]MBU1536877.1 poly-gamma-glutamate synthase PgsB [Myxococcota bacterium]
MFFIILLSLVGILVLLGVIEYAAHVHYLKKIPIRIHVNGTRGKSSVTRLIAAALREGGIKAFAKTTGTLPRVITDKAVEYPVFRPIGANIIEQLRIVAFVSKNGAEALVIECMALQPHLQSLTELRMIRSTHGVITNARPDHLDVMGPDEQDVALALLGSTPRNSRLYTAERDYVDLFDMACKDRGTTMELVTDEEVGEVSDEDMTGFAYVEHKENVALALRVCADCGVDRAVALAGMHKVKPDNGAMLEYELDYFGRRLLFINGFAANDPESSKIIWDLAKERHPSLDNCIMILNMRNDRPDRSRQIGEAIPSWTRASKYIVIGSGTHVLIERAVGGGIEPNLFINGEGLDVDGIFETILDHAMQSVLIVGIGNIKNEGLDLVRYFRNRSKIVK